MNSPRTPSPFTSYSWYLFPGVVLFLILFGVPLGLNVWQSFTAHTPHFLKSGEWVGLANYHQLFQDPSFLESCLNLLLFTLFTSFLELGIALGVSWYLNEFLKPSRWVETLLILPMFVIPVVSGLTFRYLMDPSDGPFAHLALKWGLPFPSFLDHPASAFLLIVIQDVWRMWPFVFLIVHAGYLGVPKGQQEAAKLEGASRSQRFWHVTLPYLIPSLVMALVLKAIESLKAFTEVYVLTGGGPGDSTQLMSLYVVKQALVFLNLPMASAASTVLFLAGAVVALGFVVVKKRQRASSL